MEEVDIDRLRRTEANFNLGSFHRQITTSSPDAQQWFDKGMIWTYAFNHEAGIKCFQAAIKADKNCTMAYWGISFANGVNYNNAECEEEPGRFPSNADAFEYGHKAARLAECERNVSPVEKALVGALLKRNSKPGPSSKKERTTLNKAFAEAMEEVYNDFPDDPDVACIFAESMMNVRPWDLWVDGKLREADENFMGTERIMTVFAKSLPRYPDHPGMLHFYLHALEMSPDPDRCLAECERLLHLVPDAGHLLHMPSHIYVLVGRYAEAVLSNQKAIAADRKFFKANGAANFYTLYRCHDYHMLVYAAMFQGVYESAMAAAREMQRQLLSEEVEMMMRAGLADFLESFIPLPLHVLIRFGRWEDILEEPFPSDQEFFCTTTAVLYYARCLAFASLQQVGNALAEIEKFEVAYTMVKPTRTLFNNTSKNILAVGRQMMYGEVEYRRGNFEDAFEHLRQAVKLDDSLHYDEPWGWMQPARHALGALLLEKGRVEDAEEVYRADLEFGKHPNNVWSLHGLAECLRSRGADQAEVSAVEGQLRDAESKARIKIQASCFCRLSAFPSS